MKITIGVYRACQTCGKMYCVGLRVDTISREWDESLVSKVHCEDCGSPLPKDEAATGRTVERMLADMAG